MVSGTVHWLAETPSPPPVRYVDPQTVGPGLTGFVIFVFLCGAVFLLWKSMNKQLKKIDFEEESPRPVNAPFTSTGPQDARKGSDPDS